ncbi:hypothetical protein EV361DRAFT_85739 [Lentinula raphanica]|nr:hypothetical protein EV361DRAFT_85739 [Lentinula raphanica]
MARDESRRGRSHSDSHISIICSHLLTHDLFPPLFYLTFNQRHKNHFLSSSSTMMILQSSDTPLSTPRIVPPTADSERSRDTIQKNVSSGNLLTPSMSIAGMPPPSRNTSPAPTESEGVPVKICDTPSVCFSPLHSGYPSPAPRPSFPTVVPGPYTPPRVVSPVSRMSTPRSLYESIPHLHGGLPAKPNAQSAQTVIAQTPVPIIIPQPHSFYSRSRSRSRSPARYRSPSSPPSRSRSRSTSRSRFRSRRFRTTCRDYRSISRSYSRSRLTPSVVQCPILPYNMSPRPRSHSRPPVRINTRDSSPTRANADSSLLSTPAFRPLPLHSLRPGDKTTTGMGALPPLPTSCTFPFRNSGMGSNLGNNTKGYPNPPPMIPTPYASHVWQPSSPFIPPAYPLPKVPGVANNPSAQTTQPFQQATPSYHMSIPPAFPPGFIPVDPSFGPPPQWGPRGCTMTPDVAMPINYGNLKPHYRFFFSDGSLTVEVRFCFVILLSFLRS